MTVEQKLVQILRNNTNIEDLDETNLNNAKFSQLGINSLNFIKIIVELEDEFGIEFDDSQINYELLNNIEELVKLIKRSTDKNKF